jgi:hypothetical protein
MESDTNVSSMDAHEIQNPSALVEDTRTASALRMMTTGDEAGRRFWGGGKITKSLRAAVAELRALVAKQAAAILRLLNHLANPGGGAAPAAIAAGSAPAPAALARPTPSAAAEPQPSPPMLEIAALSPARPPPPPDTAAEPAPPARAAPDGGGGLTMDQIRPLLRKALSRCRTLWCGFGCAARVNILSPHMFTLAAHTARRE